MGTNILYPSINLNPPPFSDTGEKICRDIKGFTEVSVLRIVKIVNFFTRLPIPRTPSLK